jgi:hypothetical protein
MKMLASEHVLVQWERTTNGLYAVCIGCGDHHHNVRRIGDEVGPGENSLETEARPPLLPSGGSMMRRSHHRAGLRAAMSESSTRDVTDDRPSRLLTTKRNA